MLEDQLKDMAVKDMEYRLVLSQNCIIGELSMIAGMATTFSLPILEKTGHLDAAFAKVADSVSVVHFTEAACEFQRASLEKIRNAFSTTDARTIIRRRGQ